MSNKVALSILLLSFLLLTGCQEAFNNLNPTTDVTKNNKSIKSPSVTAVNVTFDRFIISGTNLDKVTAVKVTGGTNNHTLTLLTQSTGEVQAAMTTGITALQFYAGQTYDLIISSASGQSIIPINFQILDNTITTGKLQTSSVTSTKIATRAVTFDKIDNTGAANGDVLKYSDVDGKFMPAPESGGGGGGGSVSAVYFGSGLVGSGSGITTTGTINVNIGSGSGQIPTLGSGGSFNISQPVSIDRTALDTGYLSLKDSLSKSDFRLYTDGPFKIMYTEDYTDLITYPFAEALSIEDDGDMTTTGDLFVGGGLTVNGGGAETYTLPGLNGSANQFLMTDGVGGTSWQTVSGTGTVTSVVAGTGLTGGPITTSGTLNVNVGITNGTIAQVGAGNKLPVSIIPTAISAANISAGNVSDTEFDYLNNVTSPIQTQLIAKEPSLVAGLASQYYRGDKSWQAIQATDVTETMTRKFMDINDYAAIISLPLSGVADQLQPVSERTVALLKESVAVLSAPMADLNTKPAPSLNYVPIGNGVTFSYVDFEPYTLSHFHITAVPSSLLIGMGTNSAVTGANNTALGSGAMAAVVSGPDNTGIGFTSLAALTSGSNNTALGSRTLDAVTSGTNNTAVGYSALGAISAASYNTALGAGVMVAATGAGNIGIGYNALSNGAFTGAGNITLGSGAMIGLTSGANNVVIGNGISSTMNTASSNVIIGYGAGANMLTSSDSNIIIGASAGPSVAADTDNYLYLGATGVAATPLISGRLNQIATDSIVYVNVDPTSAAGLAGVGLYALYVGGEAYKTSGTSAWIIPSDARLKDVTGDYAPGLEEILKINTVRYHYKDIEGMQLDSSKEHVGILAQEIQQIFPDAVALGPNGYLSFQLDPVFWGAVNAIQELNQKVQKVEAENKLLKDYLCQKDKNASFCLTP